MERTQTQKIELEKQMLQWDIKKFKVITYAMSEFLKGPLKDTPICGPRPSPRVQFPVSLWLGVGQNDLILLKFQSFLILFVFLFHCLVSGIPLFSIWNPIV